MSKMYLGVDIGGTAVKLGLVDENGQVVSRAERSVSFDGYKTPSPACRSGGWHGPLADAGSLLQRADYDLPYRLLKSNILQAVCARQAACFSFATCRTQPNAV